MLVTILSCTDLSPVSPITAINPMAFVLVVSLIREGYEDYNRYKSDKSQNSQNIKIFNKNKAIFETKTSADLKIGDLMLCQNGDKFPADLVLLTSSNDGDCFIKTSSLDGEKNLKKRT
jgi:P-type E1-E2 ATPase